MKISFILDLMFKKHMKILEKIKNNFNTFVNKNKNFQRTLNWIKVIIIDFKPTLIVILMICIYFIAKRNFNYRFGSDIIEGFLDKSKYVGNAIIIRDNYVLTTYQNLVSTCGKVNDDDKVLYYVIINNNLYPTTILTYDKIANLAILKVNSNRGKKFFSENFIIFPENISNNYLNEQVYISKNLNSGYNYFYEKFKVKGISMGGFAVNSFDIFRKNSGESVLNSNLEFVGITTGNTENKIKKITSNKIEFIDAIKIQSFLKKNRIFFYSNKQKINLFKIKNYLSNINTKLLCYTLKVPPRKMVPMYR